MIEKENELKNKFLESQKEFDQLLALQKKELENQKNIYNQTQKELKETLESTKKKLKQSTFK